MIYASAKHQQTVLKLYSSTELHGFKPALPDDDAKKHLNKHQPPLNIYCTINLKCNELQSYDKYNTHGNKNGENLFI